MNDYDLKAGLITLISPKLKGVGSVFIRKHITNGDFFHSDVVSQISSLLAENKKYISEEVIYEELEIAKEIISQCSEENIEVYTIFDSEYPHKLKQLKNAPPIIYVKGNVNILNKKTICIIGTRDPNYNGVKITQRVAEHYKLKKWNVCNGLADGIDSAAIQFADNYYSNVIGIVAGGLNYNSKKTLLKKTIVNAEKVIEAGGVVISELPPNEKETTFTVIKSCRIQAGVSDGLFLIQSSIDGGSKFTLTSFCETNRPIAVINPVGEDENLRSYSANIAIRDNNVIGLSKITDLKTEKIYTSNITMINSKADYETFDNLLSQKNNNNQATQTLFD